MQMWSAADAVRETYRAARPVAEKLAKATGTDVEQIFRRLVSERLKAGGYAIPQTWVLPAAAVAATAAETTAARSFACLAFTNPAVLAVTVALIGVGVGLYWWAAPKE